MLYKALLLVCNVHPSTHCATNKQQSNYKTSYNAELEALNYKLTTINYKTNYNRQL